MHCNVLESTEIRKSLLRAVAKIRYSNCFKIGRGERREEGKEKMIHYRYPV